MGDSNEHYDRSQYYDRLAKAELERRQAVVDAACAEERARIVAGLREYGDEHLRINREAQIIADLIERGEIGGA